ncbi:MAG: ABC-type transport auxiliary lipoprotein family protein [Oceanospirillaceae bacterium]
MILRALLVASALLFLGGCSLIETEQPVTYYVLDAEPLAIKNKPQQLSIAIDEIELPDYLSQPNLVLRDSSQKLHVAYYHSWADDLASAIRRVLMRELNQSSRKYNFTGRCKTCDSVAIRLDHFYPTTTGEVILAGEFVINRQDEKTVRHNFLLKTELKLDGYEHAVQQMRLALSKLVQQINKSL